MTAADPLDNYKAIADAIAALFFPHAEVVIHTLRDTTGKNTTVRPLAAGFFTVAVIGLIFVLIAERGKLFQPHAPTH